MNIHPPSPLQNARGNWMETASGARFYPIDPRPEEVSIDDIATHLGKLTRFNGAINRFYSVAEHSVYVSHQVPAEHALTALMHDATEAYIGDMIRPLKAHIPDFVRIEERVWRAIAKRFGLPEEMPQCVHDADNAVLLAEAEQLKGADTSLWNVRGTKADVKIQALDSWSASHLFAARFTELTGQPVTVIGRPPIHPYAIGSTVWPGLGKSVEEMGELLQVLGKLIGSGGRTDHWSGDLRAKLVEETGDTLGALAFLSDKNLTQDEERRITERADQKFVRFEGWHENPEG